MNAQERFSDFIGHVQAEVRRELPTMEEVYMESSSDDHDRADSLTRNIPDTLVTVGRQVRELNDLVYMGWERFYADRAHWDASPRSRKKFLAALRLLRSCAWAWHQRARVVISPDMEKVRGMVFSCSWFTYMSATLLLRSVEANIADRGVQLVRSPLLFMERADENSFVHHLLSAQQANIVLSPDRVGAYTVQVWKETLDGLWDAINRYGLTPSSARLYDALTLRYAAWLVHDEADYEHVSEKELNRVFSHWTLCHDSADRNAPDEENDDDGEYDDTYTGPLPQHAQGLAPMMTEGLLPLNERLRVSFVIHGEMMLFHGIRYIESMRAFTGHPEARPLIMAEALRRQSAKAIVDLAKHILSNSALTTEANETVKSLLMRRHLRPGDAETAMFEAGSRIGLFVEGDEVMYDINRVEFMRLNKDVLPLDLGEHLTNWYLALDRSMALPFTGANDDREWDAIAAQRPRTERAAFVVLETALDIFLRVRRVPQSDCSLRKFAYADDAGLVPPLDAPPSSPEDACLAVARNDCKKGTPLFVAMAHVYCVVLPGADNESVKRVLYTPHLVDALATWLAACHQKRLLPRNAHPLRPLWPLLTNTALVAQLK